MFSSDDFIGTHGRAESLFVLVELFFYDMLHVTKRNNFLL